MPFSSDFDDVYHIGIKESCEKAGAYCERVDEQIFHERILDRIYNQIAKADMIIADMSGRNANVFYEVGYAHALNKPTILLTKDAADIPFDLKHFPHIVYGEQLTVLRQNLATKIAWFIENPLATNPKQTVEIELYQDGVDVSSGKASCSPKPGYYPWPELTLANRSFRTFEPGELRLAVVTRSGEFPYCELPTGQMQNMDTCRMPDGGYFHMLPVFDTLFPQAFTSCEFGLRYSNDQSKGSTSITLRVFTNFGTRDYDLAIQLS
ncbi:Nucleoside 2-deoxyribosyltransferase [Botrimarina mediterranea]|uniref:Nucleoside 2-deoxyribosyltransferase n=2 Tax=Botrimarina mediterranea TaxID=2528022 RepID=A0A518K4J0_9BACT|nr:Nucleoside 2-deoxyribosyltransferase [Botrimarina mediterranea]